MSYLSSAFRLGVGLAAWLCLAACGAEVGPAPEGGGGAGGGPPEHHCPEVAGTWPMVLVPRSDGALFCIDSRETTNDQYAAFLAAGTPTEIHPRCTEALDFAPKTSWPPPADQGNYPVGAVTWCDAFAYCTALGKRLCGGSDGKILSYVSTDNKEHAAWLQSYPSEMWSACTRNGEQRHAYGPVGKSGICHDKIIDGLVPADAATPCEGGYNGIFNLQGNAWEWQGICEWEYSNFGAGGEVCFTNTHSNCDAREIRSNNGGWGPTDWSFQTGIRCCADALQRAAP